MDLTSVTFVLGLLLLVSSLSNATDTNIALGKTVTRSSSFPHAGWGPDNAVDGVIDQINADTCNCCAATQIMWGPWFRVDLGGMYMVSAFRVYTKKMGTETFNPTDIHLHTNKNNIGTAATAIKEDVITYNHTFTSPVTARYVTVKYKGNRVFILCEIEVYGECLDGTFGDTCGSVCHCEGSPCNKTSGVCPSGTCLPGYNGEKCDTECPTSTYGQYCAESCGQCRNNKTCHHINGTCTQCEDGYTGPLCKQECQTGYYGQFCAESCGRCGNNEICHHVNGSCTLCEDGYMGTLCKQECSPGKYGRDCRGLCGNCYNNEVCGHVDGTCTRCETGYTGDTCKKHCESGRYGQDCGNKCGSCAESPCDHVTGICSTCSAGYLTQFCNNPCPMGQYGYNCSFICGHCVVNTTCHHVNGHCVSGCDTGYTGSTCDRVYTGRENSSSAVLGGVAGAVVFVLVVAGIVGFILIRRRNATQQVAGPDETLTMRMTGQNTYEQLATPSNLGEVGKENVYDSIYPENISNDPDTTQACDYYNICPAFIKVADLWSVISAKKANNCENFTKEFKMLKNGRKADKNTKDELHAIKTGETFVTGNIRATFIDGNDEETKFIFIPCPTLAMAKDLWTLIWDQKTEVLVMLSDFSKCTTDKSRQYWPAGSDGCVVCFGNLEVKLVETQFSSDFDIRKLEVTQTSYYTNDNSPPIHVTHYHFKVWPDSGVPDTTWSLVKFWRAVDTKMRNLGLNTPVVVHDSGGKGRTGTLIALDNLNKRAVKEGCINPFQTVSKVWDQGGTQLLLSVEQYVYLHEALADSLLLGTHFVRTTQMEEICLFMSQPYCNSNMTNYDQQFKIVQESKSKLISEGGETEAAVQPLQIPSYFQTLSAAYVPTFPDGYEIIQAKSPNQYSLHNFWTMVEGQRSKTLIMMTNNVHQDYKIGCFLGSESENSFGSFDVKFSDERKYGKFIQRIFKMEGNDIKARIIAQYTFTAWDEDSSVPRDVHSLIDMLNHVTSWQTQHQQKEPVIVYCGDGATRSGLVSVLLNEINRIRSTGDRVNIVESVKTMKDVNKNIIPTSEQLIFCYNAILCYLGKE